MKKILPILIIVVLVLSGLGAGAVFERKNNSVFEKTFTFSTPVIKTEGEYFTLDCADTDHYLRIPGKPEIPVYTYSFDLPFGVENVEILCSPSLENEQLISGKIKPSPQAIQTTSDSYDSQSGLIEDHEVYSNIEKYPGKWFDYKITSGLKNENNRVTHISCYLYPMQYSPALNKVYSINDATIKITYSNPKSRLIFSDEYDLVIIAPEEFSDDLQPLIQHKNDNNIATFLKTTEEIFNEYTGVDPPEQIKFFIKYAIETYNINYVLLVGGLKSYYNAEDRDDENQGSENWYVPVRYTNIEMSGGGDPGCISDLYYADIYDGEANFSSWDSNDDGIFAHWGRFTGVQIDDLDLNPDVYVGRLPCRSKFEVKVVVQKIIMYEQTSPDRKSWYDKMIGIAGMSHAMHQGQPDGEYIVDTAFEYMTNRINDEVRVYSSNEDTGGPLPIPKDICRELSKGAGFVLFEGHGHPIRWDTHPVGDTTVWIGGLHLRDMWKLFNLRRLPFAVIGGCHNGEFNITWYRTKNADEFNDAYWTHGDPGAECFSWRLVTIPYGGAIATVGATGLTVSWSGTPISLNSEIEVNIFEQIGTQNVETPGEAIAGSLINFIDSNPSENTETHCITIVHLFGDPSLQFGGIE